MFSTIDRDYCLFIMSSAVMTEVNVTTYSTEPPWDFLLSASKNSLQSFELSRLSNAANLRKEIAALMDQWLADQASATVARLLLQERERTGHVSDAFPRAKANDAGAQSASDNVFADRTAPQPRNGCRP
jgi:hypothetical protein